MMLLLLLLNVFSWANVQSLMKAKTGSQIERIHQSGVQERILKERCDIELRQKWIPVSCFAWLSKNLPQKSAHAQMLTRLNKRCLVSLENNPPLPQRKLLKNIVAGPCLVGIKKYYLDHQYKVASRSSMEEVIQSVDVGKEIVNESTHEPPENYKDQQLPPHRDPRGGLN